MVHAQIYMNDYDNKSLLTQGPVRTRSGLPSTLIRCAVSPKTHRSKNALESGSKRKRIHIVLVLTVAK